MHTLELRQKASLTSTESKYRFNKALSDLHADMMIQPVGIAQAGRWGYAMIYEITARYHPEIVEEARFITELQAQKNILISFFNSVGLASQKELSRVFPWKKEFLLKACNTLVAEKKLLDLGGVDKNTHYFSSPAIFRLQ
jgi:uncharacterized protein YcaQ